MADFILGRLKFHFKGDWVTATAYIKDDVVRYGGNSFVAMANHTSSTNFETDLSSTMEENGRRARVERLLANNNILQSR